MLVLATGCVATAEVAVPRGIVVAGPPPPTPPGAGPREEIRSAPQSPSAVWVSGYWHWTSASYTWVPGHWEVAPPGARWYGPRYVQGTDGRYYYEPGNYRR
ncbi:MAG TPA: hypothetical protein VGH87_29120 [Polyangiaceae bacterium]|nr:hypothetical protein [Polyangiaceae bacterium]